MGCGASLMQKQEPAEAKVTPAMLGPGAKSTRSPLTKDQINSRIVCSPKPVKTKVTDKLTAQHSYGSAGQTWWWRCWCNQQRECQRQAAARGDRRPNRQPAHHGDPAHAVARDQRRAPGHGGVLQARERAHEGDPQQRRRTSSSPHGSCRGTQAAAATRETTTPAAAPHAMSGGAAGGAMAMAMGKAASGDAAAAAGNNFVDDEIFKRMEAEFCRELGVDTSAA